MAILARIFPLIHLQVQLTCFLPFWFHEIFSLYTFKVQMSVYTSGGLACLHASGTGNYNRAANHTIMPKTYCSSHLPAKDWKFWNYLLKRPKVRGKGKTKGCSKFFNHYRYWYRSCLCHFLVPPRLISVMGRSFSYKNYIVNSFFRKALAPLWEWCCSTSKSPFFLFLILPSPALFCTRPLLLQF